MKKLMEILLIVAGVLILCVAGIWLWTWATSHHTVVPAQTVTNFPAGEQYPSQVSVGVSSSGQSSQSQQPTDIDSAYSSLFSQLGADEAVFVAADASSTGDLGDIYALYSGDVGISQKVSPGASDYSVDVALTDLNGDGTNEALVLENLPGFCGTEGCTLDVYQKESGTWKKIFTTTVEGDVGLSNVYVDGYQSLLLTLNSGGPTSQVVTYSWNGTTYVSGQVVASWSGSGFQIAQ